MPPRQLLILAGGLGSRLKSELGGLPKPMADICGKPLLQRQIEVAARDGFSEILLLISYRADVIQDFFGDGSSLGVKIEYSVDERPLGTAGAVLAARHLLRDRFAVCYGDTLFDLDIDKMWQAHTKTGAAVTLFLHPNDHPQDSDLVELDGTGSVIAFHGYPHSPELLVRNRVNAAFYIMEKSALAAYPATLEKLDFGKDLFPDMIRHREQIHGYESREYIKDMGTPKRLEKVRADFAAGRVAARNSSIPCPAVFLDRDGTLNVENGWINSPSQIELLPGSGEALKQINRSGFLAVLVTNQPVIARGECTEQDMERIHARLEMLLGAHDAYLDAIYYCPHHPEAGWAGERTDLKITCKCRKPEAGLIYQAAADLNIDLIRSYMIGDSWRDIEAAKKAGLKGILVGNTNTGTPQGITLNDIPELVF